MLTVIYKPKISDVKEELKSCQEEQYPEICMEVVEDLLIKCGHS